MHRKASSNVSQIIAKRKNYCLQQCPGQMMDKRAYSLKLGWRKNFDESMHIKHFRADVNAVALQQREIKAVDKLSARDWDDQP